jgi:hypothetical protein
VAVANSDLSGHATSGRSIIVDNGVAPAPQTLVSVTRPIEEAMNGVPGIQRIKSKTLAALRR